MTRKLHDNIVQLTEHSDYRFTLNQLLHGKTIPEIRTALMERGYTFTDANHVIEDVQMTLQLEDTYATRMQRVFSIAILVIIALVFFAIFFFQTIVIQ